MPNFAKRMPDFVKAEEVISKWFLSDFYKTGENQLKDIIVDNLYNYFVEGLSDDKG